MCLSLLPQSKDPALSNRPHYCHSPSSLEIYRTPTQNTTRLVTTTTPLPTLKCCVVTIILSQGLPWWLLQCRRPGFDPWVGKIPWRRKWQPTPVFLPGNSHGPRSLVGYRPRGRKESDTTERLLSLSLYCIFYVEDKNGNYLGRHFKGFFFFNVMVNKCFVRLWRTMRYCGLRQHELRAFSGSQKNQKSFPLISPSCVLGHLHSDE